MNREADDSLEELPPLRLGLQGADDPPAGQPMDDDGSGGRQHWRWWLALGVALVAGATAGAIGANARNDAIERNEIMLAAGEVAAEELADGASSLVGFGVYNASGFSVKIESFEVDGWTRTGATELVTVEPGTWARLRMNAEPDCGFQGDLVRAGAEVHTTGGDIMLVPHLPSGRAGIHDAWEALCTAVEDEPPSVEITDVRIEPREPGADSLAMRLEFSTFMRNTQVTITDVSVFSSGQAVRARGLPVEVSSGRSNELTLQWHVGDCQWVDDYQHPELMLTLQGRSGKTNVRHEHPMTLPEQAEMALMFLMADACRTQN